MRIILSLVDTVIFAIRFYRRRAICQWPRRKGAELVPEFLSRDDHVLEEHTNYLSNYLELEDAYAKDEHGVPRWVAGLFQDMTAADKAWFVEEAGLERIPPEAVGPSLLQDTLTRRRELAGRLAARIWERGSRAG